MSELYEKERHYQRLDQLRDAYPDIYNLSHSDAHVRSWLMMWTTSEMSLEEGLAKLCLLLCEHRKELTEGLLEQLSWPPRIFGVDLAKAGSERTAFHIHGDRQARQSRNDDYNRVLRKVLDAMPTADKPEEATDPLGQILQNAHQTREKITYSVFPFSHPASQEEDKPEKPQEKLRDKFKLRLIWINQNLDSTTRETH